MANIQQKSEKITALGGIFFVLDKFDPILSSVIDDPNKKIRINLPVSAKIINFAARIGLKTCR